MSEDAQVNLRVNVEGEDKVKSLASSLDELGKGAEGSTAKAINIDTTAAASAAGEAVRNVGDAVKASADNVGTALQSAATNMAEKTEGIKSTFDRLKAGFDAVDWTQLAGSVGGAVGEIGAAVVAVGALGAAIGVLAVGAAAAATAVKFMSDAMGYAQNLSQDTIKNAGRAARAQSTLADAEADSAVGTELLGKSYDRLNDQMIKRLSDFRLGKGMPGDKEIFDRLNLTPETLRTEGAGRVTILDLMQRFNQQYADLQKQLGTAPTEEAKSSIQEQMGQMRTDLGKVFGAGFADVIASITPAAMAEMRKVKDEAPSPTMPENQMLAGALDLRTQMFGLQETWKGLQDIIGSINLQPVATFFDTLRQKANEIGPAVAELVGSMSAKGWESLTIALQQIDVQQWVGIIKQWTDSVKSIDATDLAAGVGETLNSVATFLQQVAQGVTQIMQALAALSKVWGKVTGALDFLTYGNMQGIEKLPQAGAQQQPAAQASQSLDQLAQSATTAKQSLDSVSAAQKDDAISKLKAGMGGSGAPAATADVGAAPAERIADAFSQLEGAGTTAASSMQSGIEAGGASASSSIQAGVSTAGATMQAALVAGGQAAAAAISASAAAWGATAGAALRAAIAGISIPVSGVPAGAGGGGSPSRGADNPVGSGD